MTQACNSMQAHVDNCCIYIIIIYLGSHAQGRELRSNEVDLTSALEARMAAAEAAREAEEKAAKTKAAAAAGSSSSSESSKKKSKR
jgi:hypothetical protein